MDFAADNGGKPVRATQIRLLPFSLKSEYFDDAGETEKIFKILGWQHR